MPQTAPPRLARKAGRSTPTRLTLRFLSKHFPSDLLKWGFTPADDLPERLPEPERNQSKPDLVIPAKYEAAVVALKQVLIKRYSWRAVNDVQKLLPAVYSALRRHPPARDHAQTNQRLPDGASSGSATSACRTRSQILSAIKMLYIAVADTGRQGEGLIPAQEATKTAQRAARIRGWLPLLAPWTTPKHRCILMLVYSAGLRLGEVVGLRLCQPICQPERNRLFVRGGKGKKDRCTLLSGKGVGKTEGLHGDLR
jgi:integrase